MTMRTLDAIFATLKSIVNDEIVDDIVKYGIALRGSKACMVMGQEEGWDGGPQMMAWWYWEGHAGAIIHVTLLL